MSCISCRLSRHGECRNPSIDTCCCRDTKQENPFESDSEDGLKDNSQLLDPLSTGRKRAARMYPWQYVEDEQGLYIKVGQGYVLDKMRVKPGPRFRRADCEWKGKSNVGGGKHPIQGCTDGVQECRHHGPDKDTRNNEPGNVHRICTLDHNKWHAANDKEHYQGITTESD